MLQAEEISDLSEYLRQEGFTPSLYQIFAAQEVIREYSSRDAGLGSLVRLTTLLRPVFSSTREQQERFGDLYLQWLRARSRRPYIPLSTLAGPPPIETPKTHWRMKLVVPCLLILPALTAWFLWQDFRTREAVGRVVEGNQPVAHATVRLGERIAMTDELGTFTVTFKNGDMPLQLRAEMKGYIPSQFLQGQSIQMNRRWLYLSSIDMDEQFRVEDVHIVRDRQFGTTPNLSEPATPKISLENVPTFKPTTPPWWSKRSDMATLVVLTPIFFLLAWFLYRFTRRTVLKRQSSCISPELKRIQVQTGTHRLFPSLSLRHVTQRLRQPRFEESAELDVQRTISCTIQRGGLFTPAFGSKREPSYVALIDRATVADHHANVAAQLVKDLAKGSVLVRQYEFDEEPTMLRVVDPLGAKSKYRTSGAAVPTMVEVMTLSEVQAKFPTSRLLCFTEPFTCFDPLTGKLRPWVEALEAWEERFLFTIGAYGQWGQAAHILRRHGFQIIPLTHFGLQLFAYLVEQGDVRTAPNIHGLRERWSIYDRSPERWLDRYPPPRETISKLINDLQNELRPDGFLWLAACAAYPEIHWALTLEWGARLFGRGAVAESILPKLTPLIWFRQAFMPDWFRQALYERLTGQEAERISQELSQILSALNTEGGNQLQLHIATQLGTQRAEPAPVGRFAAWIQKLRLRSALQEMGQVAEPDSPMRDFIMRQYLSGKQGKALTPYAPKALLRLLFPNGQPWLGFRPILFLLGASVVSAGLWWSTQPMEQAQAHGAAVDLFYNLKQIELRVNQLEALASEPRQSKEVFSQLQELRNLQNKYDRALNELDIGANMNEQDRAIFRVVRLLGECDAAMPKEFLAEVNRYIQRWKSTERLRAGMRRALEEGYVGIISNALFTKNLPPQFLYIALQESGFYSKALGPKTASGYAKGMWQFTPRIAAKYKLKVGPLQHVREFDPDDERFDPTKSTRAAAQYLKDLYLTEAQGSGLLVIAAYNWGEGALKLTRQLPADPQNRNFWELLKRFKIPQETYDYVFYVISAAVIGEDPYLFGFDFPAPLPTTRKQ